MVIDVYSLNFFFALEVDQMFYLKKNYHGNAKQLAIQLQYGKKNITK